ncbi:hypothetical protein MMC13_000495 [Lambiella insularis]|nr:hypothetical protein [Lambiella insularis]
MNRRDPRIRQTLNRISSTLENANHTTQASLFSFSEQYINPCLSSLNTCLEASCYPCIGARRDVERRSRNRNRMGRSTQRGRPELVFDFYNDDWDDMEDGEGAGLLGGWGNDELDQILAGSRDGQPRRKRAMSYGSRGAKRKGVTLPGKGGEIDPTMVPNSSMFGFLERLPWKIGGRGVKYKPSAADLQEHPGRKSREEGEALIEESENEDAAQRQQRKRSGTTGSRSTTNSLSSRGDLFPSEDEDDAVPLDDEFAMVLERRNTNNTGTDEASSGRTRGKRPSASKTSVATESSKDTRSTEDRGREMSVTGGPIDAADNSDVELPTLDDLRLEEERLRQEEDEEVERKRRAAHQLALERGLPAGDPQTPSAIGDQRLQLPQKEPPVETPHLSSEASREGDQVAQANPEPDRPPDSPRTFSSVD